MALFISTAITTYAQDVVDKFDHSKYWYYRYRLTHKFLKKGEVNYGCMEPGQTPAGIPTGYSIPAAILTGANEDPQWGDSTAEIGWYLGVLATEYRLLKNSGQSTASVEQELYFALKAYERVDLHATTLFYPKNNSCVLDGFFGRDDVNFSFVKKEFPGHENNFNSCYGHNNGSYEQSAQNSIDHISHLFMGLALVVKCLDDNNNYQGFYFKNQAKLYVKLMSTYLKNHNWTLPIPGTNQQVSNVKNIIEIQDLAYGIAKAADKITGDPLPSDNIMNLFSIPWEAFQTAAGTAALGIMRTKNDSNLSLIHSFMATGNSLVSGAISTKMWEKSVPNPLCPFICPNVNVSWWCYMWSPLDVTALLIPGGIIIPPILGCGPISLPDITVNTTALTLSTQGAMFNTEIYPLLNQYLFDNGNGISTDVYKTLLHSAPCIGPNFQGGSTGTPGWRVSNRWVGNRQAQNGVDYSDFYGKYVGLDYMLLYNLFRLKNPTAIAGAYDQSELNLNLTNQNFSTSKDYVGFESINFSGTNQVNTGVTVRFKSASISMQPGFIANSGANATFTASTDFSCDASQMKYSRIDAEQSAPTPSNESPIDTAKIRQDFINYVTPLLNAKIQSINWDSLQVEVNRYSYVPIDRYLNSDSLLSNEKVTLDSKVYPNPFSKKFILEWNLGSTEVVSISITNAFGQRVSQLMEKKSLPEGSHQITFDAHHLPAGVYFYTIQTSHSVETKTIIKLD